MESLLGLLKPYLEMLLGQYGQAAQLLASLIALMGLARMIFKPLHELVAAVVKATPSQKDDEALSKVEGSKAYAALKFAVDYLFSIKLPGK